ncbi:pilus assembly protein CpaC [Desulfobaculum xiamenense]|uniref:Pilus assembly protein CpaC n=1 Tax=Desulfobaculum xiamenense TaxID=995050 RepID=A0A846QES1_9BACT|nr:type II and III secretion system protein family protein [Desulfobaculum xiamenense]NJB67256.1 pilus assembly protein CpaC [Desulfobaculum xiamenense]
MTTAIRRIATALALMAALATAPALAGTQGGALAPGTVDIAAGQSLVVDTPAKVSRVSIASPEIAEVMVLSPRQLYLTGKAPGATTLTLWADGGAVMHIFTISVTPDLSRLKEMLHRVLPDERDIQVMAAHDSITLSGSVSSSANLSTALDIARVFATDPKKVTNLLHVGGVHQVMLEVKVAEMSRTVMNKLGIDLSYAMNGDFFYTMLNDLWALDNENGPLPIAGPAAVQNGALDLGNMRINPSRNGLFRFHRGQATFTGFLQALKQNGLVKILAEPTLICRSGEEASFLAGGEIPIPVPQALGNISIEYKPYGVGLHFTPTVLSQGRISLDVKPEVSELDYQNAIQVQGFSVPAITSRRAATVVELGDGQSFAIAGLLQDTVREGVDKYPALGDVPVLGMLFSSKQFQKAESELVIIVTPHLAKPVDMARQTLPTDHFTEPDEFEFLVMGKLEGERNASPAAPAIPVRPARAGSDGPEAGMEGDFGHILPLH